MNTRKKKKWTTLKLMLFVGLLFPLVQVFGQEKMNTSSKDTYVIITSDATKAELEKLQDELFERNKQLIFEKLDFKDGKISEIQIKGISKKGNRFSYYYNKSKITDKGLNPLFCLQIYFSPSEEGVGGLGIDDISALLESWDQWELLTAGIGASKRAMKELQERIEQATAENKRKTSAMSPEELDEKQYHGKGSSTYEIINEESLYYWTFDMG